MDLNKEMLEKSKTEEKAASELSDDALDQVTGGFYYQSGAEPMFPAGSVVAYNERCGGTYDEVEHKIIPRYRTVESTVGFAARIDGVYRYHLLDGAVKKEYELRLVRRS